MLRRRFVLIRAVLAVGLLLGSLAVIAPAAQAAAPAPAVVPVAPAFGPAIDPLADYVGQTTCDPTPKPGAIALRDLLEATYPVTSSLGITRDCAIGGQSEHKEGRAYDWAVNSSDPVQKVMAADFLYWLTTSDGHGNLAAMARRLGIMYMVWEGKIWKSYAADKGWQLYTGANPHTDHVHFSLSIAGGNALTSWYSPPTAGIASSGVAFHPVSPRRLLDTRSASRVGPYGTPMAPRQARDVTVTGAGGVPFDAGAVALNVTVTGTTAAGFLTIWPNGQGQPAASSLNWAAGQTIANGVTAKVGSGGRLTLYNEAGSTNVIIDVVGYYDAQPGDGFSPMAPARIQDSRPGPQVGPYSTPWEPGRTRDVLVAGVAGVPTGVDAVVVNVTVTNATAGGYLTVWPAGQPRPTASSLNWAPGQTIANAVTVKAGTGGKVSVFNEAGLVDVIVDVIGSFAPGTGLAYHPLTPSRVLDSRSGEPWGPGVGREVQVAGVGGVPAGAVAVMSNVTATSTTASSFLTIWPAGQAQPLASSLNWVPNRTIPNAVSAALGASGRIAVRNEAGTVDVLVDVAGWYG